jgi:predicted RNase H-like HicB family nuclease
MSRRNEIDVEFDEASQGYYAVWETVVIGAGKTRQEALDDLRQAAHFGADTFIDLKLENINKEKED